MELDFAQVSRQEGPPWLMEILETTGETIFAGGGGGSNIKDQDWQNIFDLYSSGIFSRILFEMQNRLPSRMYDLSINYSGHT
jgi:hypothetical protein